MPARLKSYYQKQVAPALKEQFRYSSPMAIPKIAKITVNIGLGEATQNARLMDGAVQELGQITGQKPIVNRAKKSISAFKLREGMPIGCSVTLRGEHMYEFFDRLVNVALPRVRDFRGVSAKSFDGRGNYTLGLRDQLIFPEIDYAKVDKTKGMNVTITTTARTDAEGLALLKLMGMPFRS
jgi:large subunit ribosomal protein L5